MHRIFLTYTQPLSNCLSFFVPFPHICTPPSFTFFFGLSFRLSFSFSTSVSASNSNSNGFIGMTRERLARAHSPWLPPPQSSAPGPVTPGLAWSTACVMLRRGQPSLGCRVRSVDSNTMGMSASCSREGQLWQGSSVCSYTDGHCPLIPGLICLRVWDVYVSKGSYLKSKALWVTHSCLWALCVCVECKFTHNNLNAIRTCAGHLERVWVGAVVTVAANAVHGAFAGGSAVDGALQAGFVFLSRLEEARRTGWKRWGWGSV